MKNKKSIIVQNRELIKNKNDCNESLNDVEKYHKWVWEYDIINRDWSFIQIFQLLYLNYHKRIMKKFSNNKLNRKKIENLILRRIY